MTPRNNYPTYSVGPLVCMLGCILLDAINSYSLKYSAGRGAERISSRFLRIIIQLDGWLLLPCSALCLLTRLIIYSLKRSDGGGGSKSEYLADPSAESSLNQSVGTFWTGSANGSGRIKPSDVRNEAIQQIDVPGRGGKEKCSATPKHTRQEH